MMIRFLLLSLISLGVFSGYAIAAEPFTYSPEYCEFEATFPEEPYKTRRCDSDNKDRCYGLMSYTQVYELDTTVNFRVICNKISDEIFKNYSGDIMEATLKAMTENTVVKTFNTSFREEDSYKQAGLVGEGKVGRTPTIYIAQLWIGKNSSLSVEAEVIGNAHQEADQLFSDVLRSIGYSEELAKYKTDKDAEESDDDATEKTEKPKPEEEKDSKSE